MKELDISKMFPDTMERYYGVLRDIAVTLMTSPKAVRFYVADYTNSGRSATYVDEYGTTHTVVATQCCNIVNTEVKRQYTSKEMRSSDSSEDSANFVEIIPPVPPSTVPTYQIVPVSHSHRWETGPFAIKIAEGDIFEDTDAVKALIAVTPSDVYFIDRVVARDQNRMRENNVDVSN